jgi:hypothetical protein
MGKVYRDGKAAVKKKLATTAKTMTPHAYDNLTQMPTIVFETVLSRANLRPEQ